MKSLIISVLLFSNLALADSVRIGLRYSFKTAYSNIDDPTPVNELYQILKDKTYEKMFILGHTDWIASDSINQPLSEARAKSILDLLVKYGLKKSNIEVQGFGKKQPVADNTTEDGRAQNRRVSVEILNILATDLDKLVLGIEKSKYLYVISIDKSLKNEVSMEDAGINENKHEEVTEKIPVQQVVETQDSGIKPSEDIAPEQKINDVARNNRYYLGLGLSQTYLVANDITGPGLGINAYWVSQLNTNLKLAYQWQIKNNFWLGLSGFAEFQNYFNQDNTNFSWDEKDPFLFGLAIISNYDLSKFSFGADFDFRQVPFIQENAFDVTLDKEWVYNLKFGAKYKLLDSQSKYSSRIGLDMVLALGGTDDYNPKSNPLGFIFNIDISKKTFNDHEWFVGLNYSFVDYDHDFNTQLNQLIGIDFMLRSDLWF